MACGLNVILLTVVSSLATPAMASPAMKSEAMAAETVKREPTGKMSTDAMMPATSTVRRSPKHVAARDVANKTSSRDKTLPGVSTMRK